MVEVQELDWKYVKKQLKEKLWKVLRMPGEWAQDHFKNQKKAGFLRAQQKEKRAGSRLLHSNEHMDIGVYRVYRSLGKQI